MSKSPLLGDFSNIFMKILIFVTGGTFDKEYNEISGELFFRDTHLSEMLTLGRSLVNTTIETLMMIDSLEMTESHREIIVKQCLKSVERCIVITHGTDTMVETARALAQSVKDKTIILTGAMIPYKFGSSDGMFNLGSALAYVQVLLPGIYISMNGKFFNWDDVRKNKITGTFEKIKLITNS